MNTKDISEFLNDSNFDRLDNKLQSVYLKLMGEIILIGNSYYKPVPDIRIRRTDKYGTSVFCNIRPVKNGIRVWLKFNRLKDNSEIPPPNFEEKLIPSDTFSTNNNDKWGYILLQKDTDSKQLADCIEMITYIHDNIDTRHNNATKQFNGDDIDE